MDGVEEGMIDIALIIVAVIAAVVLFGSFFPQFLDAIKKAISQGTSSATDSAIQTFEAAATGVGDSVFSLGGSLPSDQYATAKLQGNPSSPGYDYIFGPQKFTFGSLWTALSTWWQETWNPALDSGAGGGGAGGIPVGTDVSNYNPGNWGEIDYAPPGVNSLPPPAVQNFINSMGWQS